jgi:protein SCO1/2
MMRSLIACILLLPLTIAGAAEQLGLKSGVFDPPRAAPDFALPASNGQQFKLSSQRGKLVVLGFGFSHCPDVCPVTLAILAQVRKQLGAQADNVQVIYVTVDPERDTAARLREYLAMFDPTFIGVTGKAEQLSAVRQAYGIAASRAENKDAKDGYLVHHSSYIYLIDRQGLLRALVPFGKTAADIVHDIKILLHEKT